MDLQSEPVFVRKNGEILVNLDIPGQPFVGLFYDLTGSSDFLFDLLIRYGSHHGFISLSGLSCLRIIPRLRRAGKGVISLIV